MKPLFLIAFTSLLVGSTGLADDRAKALRKNYESAKRKALAPIHRQYIAELKKLKKEYAHREKLEKALAIEETINDLLAEHGSLRERLESRPWIYTANRHRRELRFGSDGKITSSGKEFGRWTLEPLNVLVIHYVDANSCRFDFRDLASLTVEGTLASGSGRRSLSPK